MDFNDLWKLISGGGSSASTVMDAQASAPAPQQQPSPQQLEAPQGLPTPVTNPKPVAQTPQAYQSPSDLANMYIQLMRENRNAAQLDSGLHLIAAGLSNSPTNRAALIQGATGHGGEMKLGAADLINFQKQADAQREAALIRNAMPALIKQYNLTPAQAQTLVSSGQIGDVIKHFSTENLAQATDANGQVHFVAPRTGKIVATIGSEREDPTQVVKTPQGEQVINMRTGELVGKPAGPTDTNIDAKGTKYPALDTGYDYARDEKGLVKLTDGKPTVAALPGSKAEEAHVEAQQKKVDLKMQAAGALASVTNAVTQTEKAMDEAILPGAVGLGSKAYMKTIGQLGGTAGNVIRDNIDTIKANATFDKLAQMRQASPTGAALGSVSDFENRLLGATTATLSPNLPADQLRENMYRVQATMELLAHKKYTDEATFAADISKRINEIKAQRINKTGAGITVTRE
jgi:hypothetical protein